MVSLFELAIVKNIESAVEEVDGVLPTFTAACGEHDAEAGTDRLIVFCVLTSATTSGRAAPRLCPASRATDEALTIQPSGLYLIAGGIGTGIAEYLLAAYGVS